MAGRQAAEFERPRAGCLSEPGCTRDSGAIQPVQDMAAVAARTRKSDALFRRHPAQAVQSAIRQRLNDPLLHKLAIPDLGDQVRVKSAQGRAVCLIRLSDRLQSVGLTLELFRLDQRLRADAPSVARNSWRATKQSAPGQPAKQFRVQGRLRW